MELDIANQPICWIGAGTIEVVACRARLDNSDYDGVTTFRRMPATQTGARGIPASRPTICWIRV